MCLELSFPFFDLTLDGSRVIWCPCYIGQLETIDGDFSWHHSLLSLWKGAIHMDSENMGISSWKELEKTVGIFKMQQIISKTTRVTKTSRTCLYWQYLDKQNTYIFVHVCILIMMSVVVPSATTICYILAGKELKLNVSLKSLKLVPTVVLSMLFPT